MCIRSIVINNAKLTITISIHNLNIASAMDIVGDGRFAVCIPVAYISFLVFL